MFGKYFYLIEGPPSQTGLMDPSILSDTPPPGRGEIPGGETRFFSESPHPRARNFSESPHPRADFLLEIEYFGSISFIFVD